MTEGAEGLFRHISVEVPSETKRSEQASLLGRSIEPIVKSPSQDSVYRVAKFALVNADETDLLALNKKNQKERFAHNYETIMRLEKGSLKHLTEVDGKLQIVDQPIKMQQKTLDLVKQTYRQAWGALMDASHGYAVQSEQLQRLNTLKDHLSKIGMGTVLQTDPEKPLSILSGAHRTTHSAEAIVEQLIADYCKENGISEEITPDLIREYREIKSLPPQNAYERIALFCQERGSGEYSQKMINIYQKFGELKEKLHGEREAVEQRITGLAESHLEFRQLGEEGGFHFAQFVMGKETETKFAIEKTADTFLDRFNESLASNLNILVGGRLGIPLAAQGSGDTTVHAYIENIGDYNSLSATYGEELLYALPTESSQHFVFAQLVTRNGDCHGGNILISPSFDPIPIDFGAILMEDVRFPFRASYLDFPCLDQPINKQDQEFYIQMDVEEIVQKLEDTLKGQYSTEFADEESRGEITTALNVLKARLYMVQLGVQEGLTQRQLLALDFPPLSREIEGAFNSLLTLQAKIANGSHQEEKAGLMRERREAIQAINEQIAQQGFRAAWSASYNSLDNKLDSENFKLAISQEIVKIQQIPQSECFASNAREVYLFQL